MKDWVYSLTVQLLQAIRILLAKVFVFSLYCLIEEYLKTDNSLLESQNKIGLGTN